MGKIKNGALFALPFVISLGALTATRTTDIDHQTYESKMPIVVAAIRRGFREYNDFKVEHRDGKMVITLNNRDNTLPLPETQGARDRALRLEQQLKQRAQRILDPIKERENLSVESINFDPTARTNEIRMGGISPLRAWKNSAKEAVFGSEER